MGVADMPTTDPVPFAIDDSVALHCLQIRHPRIAKLIKPRAGNDLPAFNSGIKLAL